MKTFLVGAAALITTLTGAMAGATPAEAYGGGWHGGGGYHGGSHGGGYGGGRGGEYGRGYGYRRGGGAGPAIIAGLAGVALGAALTHRHGYYDEPRGYYVDRRDYYGPPPSYYVGDSYYGWYDGCRREWIWDGRWGGYRLVEACF